MTHALSWMDKKYLKSSKKHQKKLDHWHAVSKFCIDFGELVVDQGFTNKRFAKHINMKHKRLIKLLNGSIPTYKELADIAWGLDRMVEFTFVPRRKK